MTIQAGELLLRQVRPIIRAILARGAVTTVGCEDLQELEADGIAQAANMIEAAEKAGKELLPNSVAYYTLQALRSGRRFGCASRTDAMSPATQLDGHAVMLSMDAPIAIDDLDDDDEITLHSCLAATGEDPAAQGSRVVDWDAMMTFISIEDRDLLLGTAAGVPGIEMAFMYNVSPARVTQRKRELGHRMKSELGDNVLADCVRESAWEGHMRAYREKRACRYAAAPTRRIKQT